MERIPPAERYSQHPKSGDISPARLERIAVRHPGRSERPFFRKLSGGFQNANYLVERGEERFVLRFSSEGTGTARKESGLLNFLAGQGIRAPRVLNLLEEENTTVVVLEFLEGVPLQAALPKEPGPALFREIGAELAKIHAIELPRAGFVELPQSGYIGQHISIGRQYESFGLFLKEFILNTLREVADTRLSADLRDRLKLLVEDQWPLVLTTEPLRQLVHCDFNPKNVLVSEDGRTVTGVLDWEFCLSGNGLIDLGNFFRFAYDYPPWAQAAFQRGYESVRGSLPARWRDISLLMDLGNMCSFLERREDFPSTFRTARAVIVSTLAHFGY